MPFIADIQLAKIGSQSTSELTVHLRAFGRIQGDDL